jgi:hypothetical protein
LAKIVLNCPCIDLAASSGVILPAKQYLIDQQLAYRDHFVNSGFYNFPAWTNAIKGGFPAMNKLAAADTHKPRGKYTILTTIARRYTTNVGYPGVANAAISDIFNQFLIPQMFAQVAQASPCSARTSRRRTRPSRARCPAAARDRAGSERATAFCWECDKGRAGDTAGRALAGVAISGAGRERLVV